MRFFARGASALALLCALATLLIATAAAAAPARRVYAGVYLHDVTKFDQKDGVFDVDLELWAKWLGEFDPTRLVITNAAEIDRALVAEEADGAWHAARWRVRGTMRGEFPLQRFPFDAQTVAVTLELPESLGELVPDLAGSGMRERFSITGWRYDPLFHPREARVVYRSDLGSVAGEGRPTAVRRVSFEVVLRRPLLAAALKLFLPLLLVVLVALVALFLPADELEARSSIGVSTLLSCFAFQFAVSDALPDVAYLTLADSFFLLSYALTTAALLVSVVAHFLAKRDRERAALWVDRVARWLLPALCAVPVALLLRAPRAVAVPAPRATPTARHPSRRAELRVGVTRLDNLLSSPVAAALSWGVVHEEPDGTRRPYFVEAAPAVSNDALRFLAGGALEVAWRVRPEARWSDGRPLTAADLAFTLRASPEAHVAGVIVAGPREILLRYDAPVAVALEGFVPYAGHVLEPVFRAQGYEALREHRRREPTPTLGPYRIAEFAPDARLVLEPNPYFVGPRPSIPRVVVTRFPDGAAAATAFEAGRLDALASNVLSPEQARALAARRPDAVHVRPSQTLLCLLPDFADPLLARRAVRRAMLAAIDRERIRAEVFGEGGRVAHVPVPGPLPAGAEVTGYDPVAARAALAAEGAAGARVVLHHGRGATDRQIAARVAVDLRAAGLAVEDHEVPDPNALFIAGRHGGLLLYALVGERDAPPRRFWTLPLANGRHVEAARHEAFDDALAALAEREARALYPERREQLRDALFAEYSRRLPSLPLVFGTQRAVVDPALRGWDHGGARFAAGMEQWYFADAR